MTKNNRVKFTAQADTALHWYYDMAVRNHPDAVEVYVEIDTDTPDPRPEEGAISLRIVASYGDLPETKVVEDLVWAYDYEIEPVQ